MSRRRAPPFNRVRVSARLRGVLTVPAAPSTFFSRFFAAPAASLPLDVLAARSALYIPTNCADSLLLDFSSAARRQSTSTNATRFGSQIPALVHLRDFAIFLRWLVLLAICALIACLGYRSCAAPVLRVTTNLGMRSARSNSVFLSQDAFTDH
ncbi:hypothetical protein C8J57DRAFT_1302699 [Mycena rebaudengoi]|nr:hypothetical protein C8J57DRAFT_1302699 [Mycena rebaudengoi]